MVARGTRAAGEHSQNRLALAWDWPPCFASYGIVREGLRRSGYVEGQNVAVELRYAQAGQQQLADRAADLVRAKVDVIATFGDLATKIAQNATDTIPIVALGDDLLGSGLIGSLSRPGGNTTGISILAAELSAKRLELLQGMVPGLSRVAGLWDPSTGPSQVGMSENAARAMKLKLRILEVGRREDLDAAFRAARDGQLQALSVFSSPFLAHFTGRSSIVRPSIGFRRYISGKNMRRPEASCLTDPAFRRCGSKMEHW